MSEKTVLITGASSGIGEAIAEFLQDKGYRVYGTSRSPQKYPESKVKLIALEVTDTDSIQKAVQCIIEKENKIDVLINNAGAGITGASSGIGEAIAEFLQDKGYRVYGTSRSPQKYPESKVKLIALEVTDTDSIQKAVQYIIEKENKIDVLINNAGAGITGALEEIPSERIKQNFETNLFGPIEVIKAVLPQMRKQKSGMIINITSIAGYMGLPYRSVYSASKGALELITEALRIDRKSVV